MNWKEYNERLVRRGELLLDLEFLKTWEEDLEKMNSGKNGKPYKYPEEFIRFLGVLHVLFNLPFRQTEGFIRALERFVPSIKKPDHATIHRRVSKLDLNLVDSLSPSSEPVVIAVDASGVKVTNSGGWMREKWKRRKGYLKIHFAVNTKTKEVEAFEVTTEKTGDNKMFKTLVDRAEGVNDVDVVVADGAYDSKENFNHLDGKGIKPGIKIRKGYSKRGGAHGRARRKAIRELESLGYDGWKDAVGYGCRWSAETAFSGFKRTFGEFVKAKKFENMVSEIALKVFTYNLLINL
ncbi:MAG: IS5 family transposase [Candidatus Hydrothermarchaeales archaeon]